MDSSTVCMLVQSEETFASLLLNEQYISAHGQVYQHLCMNLARNSLCIPRHIGAVAQSESKMLCKESYVNRYFARQWDRLAYLCISTCPKQTTDPTK